ncbi:uncharacterized protein LOC128215235 [Mya arenaria]|uniref:uncharacterized protein LOC128215235 n=1 Tax=Mya arenaria TaxID=6604 RepID=UPI0022E98AB4|nr:uncharacterized protein LOC128215235 [Mya arenaria]
MWTSLENRPSKKQCVSPCKIFHTWCKNNGRCREKGADCTWYCECPENCNGFFCEKILTNGTDSGVPAGGETFEVNVLVEKEKKKKVSTFDKSKLAQALAGIILDRDAPPSKSGESKAESPTIDRIDTGGEISVKENITKTIIVNCTPSNDTNIMTDKSGDKQNVNTSTVLPPTLIETTQASNGSKSTLLTTTLASSTASMTSDTSTDATVMSEGSNNNNPITAHGISAGKTSELLEIIEKALQVEKITTPPSSSSTPTTLTPSQSSDTTTTTTITTASSEQVTTTTATTKTTASSGEKISSALNTENNKNKSPSMGTSPSESMSSSVINNDNLARSAINMTAGANESHGHVSKLATSLSKMDGKIRTAESEPHLEVSSAPIIVDKVPKQNTEKKEQAIVSTKTDSEKTPTSKQTSTEGLDVAKNDIAMKDTEKSDTNVRETHTEGSGFPPKDIESPSAPSTPLTSPDTLVSSTSTQKHESSTQQATSKPKETMVKSQPKSNAVQDEIRKLSETSTSQMISSTTLLQKPDADITKEPQTTTHSASIPTTKASISTSTQKLTTPTTSAESTSSAMSSSPSSTTATVVAIQTTPASTSALDIPDVEKANSNKISQIQHGASDSAPTDIISSLKPEQSASTTQTESTITTTATTSPTELSTTTAKNTETSTNTLKPSSAATTTLETQKSTTATSTTETTQKLNSTSTATTATSSATESERSVPRNAGSGVDMGIKPIVAGAADLSAGSAEHFKDFHELSGLTNKLSESVKDIKLDQIKQELLHKNIPLNELNNIL